MNVRELLEILKGYDPDTDVELAVVAPVSETDEEITVDRYPVDGVYLWPGAEDDEDDAVEVLWLVGGEEDDVEAFIDELEKEEDEA